MAVKSAERVLQIFEHLAAYPNGQTINEISTQLGYAPSSTHALLKTLLDNGYLYIDEIKRYKLGPKLIQLGKSVSSHMSIDKIAQPLLEKTMEELEETIFMAVLFKGEVIYVAKANSYKTVTTNAQIGSRKPIYCTGLGKVFLAFMDIDEKTKILNNLNFKKFTKNTVTSKEELLKQLISFRNQGYTVDDEEIEEGLYCIAVPVFDSSKHVIAALSASGPKQRMLSKKELVIKKMLSVSNLLSYQLGDTK
ncbi:MAG: IclR family transcriptional regulator [Clostridium sp.]|jgi:DNA-binding IclR family transcriptional regulator|uniref:IclR family transcriptional regulator n=1 Tax=Clostridium sp. TaxID=1506 RepID=UPI0025C66E11|nr:IclR family transcriptional regulator [Clostridium sp.]MCH3964905.1 IclR family transcriptional regulator [Clostridium sp.]MCI1716601.1 IclR family transcriptional regulator [Clostridium sp.]MCI1800917.1 IclR family transcriptional regulator [Clostridium sp.]MCI1814778.1 IclR family transcriptional regulator [Clostridium sp.]MCI1871664.1 IclR family transcriptional regulator [Clostridium sp.]